MKSCRTLAVLILAGLALVAGCTRATRRTESQAKAQTSRSDHGAVVEGSASQTGAAQSATPEVPKPAPVPAAQVPAEARLALAFKPGQVTTYRLMTGWQRMVTVRGAPQGQISEVTGGTTGNGIEVTYTQRVQRVDPNGRALLDVRIDGLKVLMQQVGDPVVDYNSVRVGDANQLLARLIGQGYQIEMGPDGTVGKVLNAENARMAVSGDPLSDQGKTAARLLSDDSIRERHTLTALPPGEGLRKAGQSWNQIQTVSFFTMGSRSFEKIYTFKGMDKIAEQPLAIINLEGVLSSKGADRTYAQDDRAGALASTFGMTFSYLGQCRLDLAKAEVDWDREVLDVQWVALDPKALTGPSQGEPNSLLLRSTHLWQLERVTQPLGSATQGQMQPPSSQGSVPGPAVHPAAAGGQDKIRLALQFQEGKALEYRFSSHRSTEIQWKPGQEVIARDPNNSSEVIEALDMVMSFMPSKVDPNGLTTLDATCKSVTAKRTKIDGSVDTQPDAVEGLKDKTFTLTVDRTGRIHDARALDVLLKEVGKAAFREEPRQGRIKDPEMISDVVASQWFLWDALSSADSNGLSQGQTWQSRLSLPTPMVSRKVRDVTYTLAGVEKGPAGRTATIRSQMGLSDRPAPASWPIPYSGRFRASGPFGFLGEYKILSLEGKGSERFDLEAGISRGYEQEFRTEMEAAVPLGLNIRPKIVIKQTLKMEEVK